MLERRRFLQALAASVVAAGVPLPIGFPEPEGPRGTFITAGIDLRDWGVIRVSGSAGNNGLYRAVRRISLGSWEVEPV